MMTKENITKLVLDIVNRDEDVPITEKKLDDSLYHVLGFDSLDICECLSEIEIELYKKYQIKIEFNNEFAMTDISLSDIISYIEKSA